LTRTPDKPPRAKAPACREQVDFQLLLREVAIPLGENQRHDAHRVIRYTNVQMAHLSMSRTPERNTGCGNEENCDIQQTIHSILLPRVIFELTTARSVCPQALDTTVACSCALLFLGSIHSLSYGSHLAFFNSASASLAMLKSKISTSSTFLWTFNISRERSTTFRMAVSSSPPPALWRSMSSSWIG